MKQVTRQTEIEHKYILAHAPTQEALASLGFWVDILQRYLDERGDTTTRRIRSTTDARNGSTSYHYTEKDLLEPRGTVRNPHAVINEEREIEIPGYLYGTLTALSTKTSPVVKKRWHTLIGDLVWELDHIYAPIDLWILEVEVNDEDRPIWVPRMFGEYHEDPMASNAAIAAGTYP